MKLFGELGERERENFLFLEELSPLKISHKKRRYIKRQDHKKELSSYCLYINIAKEWAVLCQGPRREKHIKVLIAPRFGWSKWLDKIFWDYIITQPRNC